MGYNVVKLKDYQVTASTDFGGYDLIVLTGFAPNVSTSAMNALLASGVPVLAISYWNQGYAKKLGLVMTSSAEYYGSEGVVLTERGGRSVLRYLGEQPQVYATSYTMYGALDSRVASGTEVVAQCASDLDLAIGLVNSATKRAAFGAYDAQRYTADGWRLLDVLLYRLAPPGPLWTNMKSKLDGLAQSGLLDYIDAVNEQPETYDAQSVQAMVWRTLVGWNLLDLAPTIQNLFTALIDLELVEWLQVGDLRPIEWEHPSFIVNVHHPRCGHPGDRWFAGQAWLDEPGGNGGCSAYYYPDCPGCDVKGDVPLAPEDHTSLDNWPAVVTSGYSAAHDYLTDPANGLAPHGGEGEEMKPFVRSFWVRGVDMGVSVELDDQLFFYMGDTWGWRSDCEDTLYGMTCAPRAVRNDAIFWSRDFHPQDGVDAFPYTEPLGSGGPAEGFAGVGLSGVHYSPSAQDASFWHYDQGMVPPTDPLAPDAMGGVEPNFTTNNNAVAVDFVSAYHETTIPGVVLSYSMASLSEKMMPTLSRMTYLRNWDDCELRPEPCGVDVSRSRPRTWLACSSDGLHFDNCFAPYYWSGDLPAFSDDGLRWDQNQCSANHRSWTWDHKGKFVSNAMVYVSPADFEQLCGPAGTNPQSLMCDFYHGNDTVGAPKVSAGILVYGHGRPVAASPLYLAFFDMNEFGEVDLDGKPLAYYYGGLRYSASIGLPSGEVRWSRNEHDAVPLPEESWTVPGGAGSEIDVPCDTIEEINESWQVAIDLGYAAVKSYLQSQGTQEDKAAVASWILAEETAFQEGVPVTDLAEFRGGPILDPSTYNEPLTLNGRLVAALPLGPTSDKYRLLITLKNAIRYHACSQALPSSFMLPPEACAMTLADTARFGRVYSARLIREPDPTSPTILLFGRRVRSAPLSEPWNVTEPMGIAATSSKDWDGVPLNNDLDGYGTFIIAGDESVVYEPTETNGVLNVWHTVSTWKNPEPGPYGVYTRRSKVPWPLKPNNGNEAEPLVSPLWPVFLAHESKSSLGLTPMDRVMLMASGVGE